MSTKGFTKASNMVVFDMGLSLEAIGLYIKIKHLSTIENFNIRRDHIKSISGYGETAFRRVWKELKDKKVLIETKVRNKGRFEYSYSLCDSESVNRTKCIKEDTRVDSDGNIPLDGQLSVYDLIESVDEENISSDIEESGIKELVEITGFSKKETLDLLEEARGDKNKVISCYKYSAKREVNNLFNYTRWCIKNDIRDYERRNEVKGILKFTDYEQRNYNFDKLENALLYGDKYDLPV